MKSFPIDAVSRKSFQRGAAAVEFALVALLFLLLVLGAMEFGRLLYLWNTVQEVTRNAARQAVVTDFTDTGPTGEIERIKREAVFRVDDGLLPASSEISNARVVIRWLNSSNGEVKNMPLSPADNVAACLDAGRVAQCIRFVEVCVSTGTTCEAENSIPFAPMISLFSYLKDDPDPDKKVRVPMSTVRMPVESLGL